MFLPWHKVLRKCGRSRNEGRKPLKLLCGPCREANAARVTPRPKTKSRIDVNTNQLNLNSTIPCAAADMSKNTAAHAPISIDPTFFIAGSNPRVMLSILHAPKSMTSASHRVSTVACLQCRKRNTMSHALKRACGMYYVELRNSNHVPARLPLEMRW
jgi:hypothetical protein